MKEEELEAVEMDDDLRELLSEVDIEEDEDIVEDEKIESNVEEPSLEESHLSTKEEEPEVGPSGPQQVIKTHLAEEDQVISGGDGDDEITQQLKSLVNDFKGMRDKMWRAIGQDRERIDSLLQLFLDRIQDTETDPRTCYVEAITSLMATKAGLSTSMNKTLDSMTKLVSAAKGLKSEGGSNANLIDLLSGNDDDDGFDEDAP